LRAADASRGMCCGVVFLLGDAVDSRLGTILRSFTHVDEVASMFKPVLELGTTSPPPRPITYLFWALPEARAPPSTADLSRSVDSIHPDDAMLMTMIHHSLHFGNVDAPVCAAFVMDIHDAWSPPDQEGG